MPYSDVSAQEIVRSMINAVLIVTPGFRIESVNQAACALLGYSEDELLGMPIGQICPIDQLFQVRGVTDLLQGGSVTNVERELQSRSGDNIPVLFSGSVLKDEVGGIQSILCVAVDISEAKQASVAKSEFLAAMSHELRTPLNAIIGYSEMLKEEAEDLNQEDFIPDLQRIHDAGTHLLTLINDILDLSKIEAGRTDLYLETFNVSNMVREVVAIIQPLVEKNANILEVHCEDSIGSIRADMTKVRQTLFNLLSNACKFTERGTITVDVSHQTEHGQDWVSLSVADTGIGMTPEQMGKLFQPFSQADASTTRQYGGTGLGLVLSRKFCQMMGGDITLESEYGSGSTFTCKLPTEVVKPADEPAPPEEPSTDIVIEGVSKVLVIDDDPLVHDMMKRLLSTERFHVESASDGEMGLRMARDLRPDIITLDVFMPGTDGWTVLALLKADPDLSSIPVIMITVEDNKNRGYILGTSEYMVKPIERDRLMSVLNRYRPDFLPCSVLVVEDNVETRRMMRRMLERGVDGDRG